MDLHSLYYFKKVAELQHITHASEVLHVAQPSLSRSISGLEKELGVKLFERVGKNIVLNRYGEILLRHTNNIVKEIKSIEEELLDARDEENRTVTLLLCAASKLIPKIVVEFKREHPTIRLQIEHVHNGISKTQRENFDLTLFSTMQANDNVHTVTLLEEDVLLALPESNPLSQKSALDLKEVANEKFICLQRGKDLRTVTDTYCKIAGFEPDVILESDSPELVREFISAGMGISFIPSITWQGMGTENISLVPILSPKCKRYINLSWRENCYLSSPMILFRDFLQQYFKSMKN